MLHRRTEIINRPGNPIYLFSKSNGSNELEKFKNSMFYDSNIEYKIKGKNDLLTCIVVKDGSRDYLMVFNSLGELIEYNLDLYDDSKESVEESLYDRNLI